MSSPFKPYNKGMLYASSGGRLVGCGTFLGLPRVRRASTCASSYGRVVVVVGATDGKVNCPVAVRR
jgi:hypothetical protein